MERSCARPSSPPREPSSAHVRGGCESLHAGRVARADRGRGRGAREIARDGDARRARPCGRVPHRGAARDGALSLPVPGGVRRPCPRCRERSRRDGALCPRPFRVERLGNRSHPGICRRRPRPLELGRVVRGAAFRVWVGPRNALCRHRVRRCHAASRRDEHPGQEQHSPGRCTACWHPVASTESTT